MSQSSPHSPEPQKLGSLAQAARGKQLNQARGILLFVGILTIIVNGIFLFLLPSQIKQGIDKETADARAKGMVVDQAKLEGIENQALVTGYAIQGIAIALGVVFVILGLIIKMFPVPVTVIGLVLYVLANIGFGILDPTTLARGAIFKIIIVVALAKAIQSAIAYERERAASAAELGL